MPVYDSILVAEDWISEHYLTTDAKTGSFSKQVLDLRKVWDEEEAAGKSTVRSRLLAEAGAIAQRANAFGGNSDSDTEFKAAPDDLREYYAIVRAALGYPKETRAWQTMRGGSELELPDVTVMPSPSGTALIILQAQAAAVVEDIISSEADGPGGLLAPAVVAGKPEPATSRVVSAIFLSDDAPPFVLVQAGRWMLLAERTRWPEGRFLAVDLGLVAERREIKRGGELDRTAVILGRDTLLPQADGSVRWDAILSESVQHTVGVSASLRTGIRLSVEIIANEVVTRTRNAGLPVEGVEGLAADLTRQSLRFLYRILFVLYAEASPELGVLPSQAPEYRDGYGIDRLRDLTLVELVSEHARSGTHLYESLATLFRLVDQEPEPPQSSDEDLDAAAESGQFLEFHRLRADLFKESATALIDRVKLSNAALQRVLRHLLLSAAKRRGDDAGFISYAELGINQLGAVYEGLMSYTGFFAQEDLYEVAPNGDPSKGSWTLPAERGAEIEPQHFVRAIDDSSGERKPVVHKKGTFVYRLAGRERQQSASYYTPEVLTRSVVSHSLAELLLVQDGALPIPAMDILRLTVCEPALGSGAFAIEAVRQLAEEYLKRRQKETGLAIPAEEMAAERQKVKAYLALHQVYGVDLNATAVELAEVSLWLDTMAKGLDAPWFGLHLKRGNSLIGARRAVYSPGAHLKKKLWLTSVPEDLPLSSEAGLAGRVHHFLLPAQGWGAAADTAEARTYAPEARERLRKWRVEVRRNPSTTDVKRLVVLGRRVETLWQLTRRRMVIAEQENRRHVEVWEAEGLPEATGAVSREDIEKVLNDENGAYRRLRRVMDAWAALWFWPLTHRYTKADNGESPVDIMPPDWEAWLGALEALLGKEFAAGGKGKRAPSADQHGLDDLGTWDELDAAEDSDLRFHDARPVDQVLADFPWLQVSEEISKQQGFFHWELDFAAVFEKGGFDLQLGNPPWVRPRWDEAAVLAEFDPWWQLTDKPAETLKRTRRERTLDLSGAFKSYLDDRAVMAGVSEHLGSNVDRSVLSGLQPDLYRCFMERTWRSMGTHGIVGLIHPESHFTEAAAGELRREAYKRLRRHWQFRNQKKLFEIDAHIEFGISIYSGCRTTVNFLHAASLYAPGVVDSSLRHDGSGEVPGVKDLAGNWDLRPHAERIVQVDAETLSGWAALLDTEVAEPVEARMLYPVNRRSAHVLRVLAESPRLGALNFEWTRGWEEDRDRKLGYFVSKSAVLSSWDDVILQGPHLTVATPIFQQPRAVMKSNRDYDSVDFESMGVDYIPRTSYQRAVPESEFRAAYPKWKVPDHDETGAGRSGGAASTMEPSSNFFRLAWRAMADSATVRTLHAALIPPGPSHVLSLFSLRFDTLVELAVAGGFTSSIAADFLIKLTGVANIKIGVLGAVPLILDHALEPELILRTLRLNCLVKPYAPLWAELYSEAWKSDSWSGIPRQDNGIELGNVTSEWTWDTPLRFAADRRQSLVEIDAIVAVMLDITAEELVTIYRTQFPVLQSYERDALYDAKGRQLPNDLAKAYRKQGAALTAQDRTMNGKTYALPFMGVDREVDLRIAHDHFSRLTAAREKDNHA